MAMPLDHNPARVSSPGCVRPALVETRGPRLAALAHMRARARDPQVVVFRVLLLLWTSAPKHTQVHDNVHTQPIPTIAPIFIPTST